MSNEQQPKEKKPYDAYLKQDAAERGGESQTVGAFHIKAGKAQQTGNGYIMLSGFSKALNAGITISLTSRVPKLVEAMCDAGLGDQVAEILHSKGVIG